MRLPRVCQLALFVSLVADVAPLRAESFYQLAWTANRGTVTNGSTSLGAFTITDTSWNFQTNVVSGDFTWKMKLPLGVLDPATATTRVWTNGTGADALSAVLFIPQPDDFGVQPYLLDSTNLDPGDVTFTVTTGSSGVNYSASFSFTGYFSTTATLSLNGKITPGDPDMNASSFVLKDGPLLVVSRSSGPATVVPEPSTEWTFGVAAACLLSRAVAARRGVR